MGKTVKVVSGVVALVVVGSLGTAWYTGGRIEETVRQQIEEANALSEQPLWSILDYQRGAFSSQVRYALTLPAAAGAEPRQLVFAADIAHGPFPLRRLTRGALLPVLAEADTVLERSPFVTPWFDAAQGKTPVEGRVTLQYGGKADFDVTTAPITYSMTGDEVVVRELKVDASTTTGTWDSSTKHLVSDLSLPSASLWMSSVEEDEDVRLSLKAATTEVDYRLGRFDVWVGEASARFGEMTMQVPDPNDPMGKPVDVTLGEYTLAARMSEDERFINGAIDYGVGSLVVSGQDLGSLSVGLNAERLEGTVIREISQAYTAMLPEALAALESMDAMQEYSDKTDAMLLEKLPALLPGGPRVTLDPMRWQVGSGATSLNAEVAFREGGSVDALDQALQTFQGELLLSRPMADALFERLAKMLDEPQSEAKGKVDELFQAGLSSGLMVANGDDLKLTWSFDGEQLQLNGQPVPPEQLLGLMLMLM